MANIETEIKFLLTGDSSHGWIESCIQEKCRDWMVEALQEPLEIVDSYYDTLNHELSKLKWGLRVRSKESDEFITLKGPAVVVSSGALQRQEHESRFDCGSAAGLVDLIRGLGLSIPRKVTFHTDPHVFMKSMGLVLIQKRRTLRTVRNIVNRSSASALAELAIDRVFYELGALRVIHTEVELECMNVSGLTEFDELIECLLSGSQSRLRKWSLDKLALGFALNELSRRDLLSGLLDSEGKLVDNAYDVIVEEAQVLRSR